MKRALELILVGCLLLSVLSACGKKTNYVAPTTEVQQTEPGEAIGEKQLLGLCEPLAALYTVFAEGPFKGMKYTAKKVENKDAVDYLVNLGSLFYSADAQEYDELEKGVKYVSYPQDDANQLLDIVFGQYYTTADILTDSKLLIYNAKAYYTPVIDTPTASVQYTGAATALTTDTLSYLLSIDYHDGTVVACKMKVKVAVSENNQYGLTITAVDATDTTAFLDDN